MVNTEITTIENLTKEIDILGMSGLFLMKFAMIDFFPKSFLQQKIMCVEHCRQWVHLTVPSSIL